MGDVTGRVLVNIYLDGTASAADVSAKLVDLGLEIVAVETQWRAGVISASLPISQAVTVAGLPGVRSVMLGASVAASSRWRGHGREQCGRAPAREVNTPGTVTAQGLLGRNISIGIVSDSYDTATGVARASAGAVSQSPDRYV